MNAMPPPLPNLHNAKRTRKRRLIAALCSSAFGLVAGGLLGYFSSRAWVYRAAHSDPGWDGPIGVLLYYIIVATATVFAAVAGALLCVAAVFLVSHFAFRHAHPNA